MKTTIPTQGSEPEPPPGYQQPARHSRPTFHIACWLLGLLAFAQLITVGAALTVKTGKKETVPQPILPAPATLLAASSQEHIEPRSLGEILATVTDNPESVKKTPPIEIPIAPPANLFFSNTNPDRSNLPPIADAQVERLVGQSRSLHMDGDMMRSMLKLDEAGRIDPAEPAVIYQKALLFEEMGIFIKAADHYQTIQQMGIKAGRYYHLAASKLTQGMDSNGAKLNEICIGPIKIRKPNGTENVKKAELAITILARPDQAINPPDVHVQIYFYDKLNNGDIKKAMPGSEILTSWTDAKLDWKDAGNEESLHVFYTIPAADLTDEHLFGRREFYGYVIELLYKGEVVDQQAYPRRLHSVHASKMSPFPTDTDPLPWLADDNSSLLPGKESTYENEPAPAALPTR